MGNTNARAPQPRTDVCQQSLLSAMSTTPVIRVLQENDLKPVVFQLGLSYMEPLTKANNRAYYHPFTLSVWVALSSVMMQLLGWWPSTDGPIGKWGVLAPLPAFATMAVPILFFFEWFHRPIFEDRLKKALRETDMKDPRGYYSLSPASSFYVLEYKGGSIGFIALDANSTSALVPSKKGGNTTAETGYIRHFYVEEVYRSTLVQSDLLEFALNRAFGSTKSANPQRIRVLSSDLDPYKQAAYRAANFHPVTDWKEDGPSEWKSGIYGWKNAWLEMTREEWLKKTS